MRCAACQADTAPDAHFCWACGRPMRPSATGPTVRLVPPLPAHYTEQGVARLVSTTMRYPGAQFTLTATDLRLTSPAQWPVLRTPFACTLPHAAITGLSVSHKLLVPCLRIRHQQPHTPPFLAFETHHLSVLRQWLHVWDYPTPTRATWWEW